MIQKNVHLLTFCAIAILYLMFPIKIHQWESYWYASGLESLYHVNDIHHFFRVNLNENLNFDLFNPNHPLLHLITDFFYRFFPSLRTLIITQFINIAFSLIGLWVSLKISIKIGLNIITTSLFILLLGTTNLYWYYSMSSEVYIAPSAMLICAFYFLLLLEHSIVKNKSHTNALMLIPIFYSLACSFHLLAFPFLLPIIITYYILSKKFPYFNFKLALIYLFSIGIPWAIFVYGFMLINFVKVASWNDYWNSIFVLSSMEGGMKNYSNGNFLQSFSWMIASKVLSFLHSLIRTHNLFTTFYKIVLSLLAIYSVTISIRNRKNIANIILLLWIFSFVILFTFVIKAPFNDYWLLMLFPFIFLIFFTLHQKQIGKTYLVILPLILCQFYFNFWYDIYPKSQASDKEFSLLANYQNLLGKTDHIYFFFNYGNERFFNEFWYENYIKKNKNISLLNDKTLLKLSTKNSGAMPSSFVIVSPYAKPHSSMSSRKKYFNSDLSPYLIEATLNETGSIVFQDFQKRMKQNFKIENFIIGRNESIKYEKKAQYSPLHVDQQNYNYDLLIQVFRIKPE